MPRKMSRAALRSALSAKAAAEQLVVVDALAMDAPKTKDLANALNALEVNGQSVLLVLAEKNDAIWRSAGNLPRVKTILSGYVNVRDLLGYDLVVLSQDSVTHLQEWLGTGEAAVEAEE
jgi:large subunit ribosomal protein L4